MDVAHYRFGPFVLYPSEQLLLREGEPVPVAPKAFGLLLALVSSRGRLLTREALMNRIWPDSFVEETNLTVNISLLRKTLGDMPNGRPWITTAPKRGYRFDGEVTLHCAAADGVPSATAPLSTSSLQLERAADAVQAAVLPEPALSSITSLPPRVLEPAVPERLNGLGSPIPHLPVTDAAAPGPLVLAGGRLRRGWVAAASVVALIIAAWTAVRIYRHPTQSGATAVHTLAVLPFQSLDTNSQNQYLGLGMTDALINRLGKLTQIVVRPIGAVRNFSQNGDPLDAGKKLGVQAVLDGTIQKMEGQTRVAVRLWRVDNGQILWTDSFDERNVNAFALEDSISQKLAQALTLRLSSDEQRQLATPATPNNKAYELYTQGRYYWNKRSIDAVQKSIELFQQAIDIDPAYAAAYTGLADAYILAGSYGNSFLAPKVAMPKAKQAVERALALDDSSAEAHTSLGYIRLTNDWDWQGAEQEFKRALQINPGYVTAHHWYSHELMAQGRVAESHEESETALNLDPTDVLINEHMAWHHLMAREYDRAIPQAIKAVELDPNFVQAHRVLALAYLYSNRVPEACQEFEKGVELSHNDPVARAYLARCYAVDHREPEARKILASLEQASTERYISAAEIAAIHVALNETDSALAWLDKAIDERSGSLIYLKADRVFDPLRNNPRFRADLVQINLPASPAQASSAH